MPAEHPCADHDNSLLQAFRTFKAYHFDRLGADPFEQLHDKEPWSIL